MYKRKIGMKPWMCRYKFFPFLLLILLSVFPLFACLHNKMPSDTTAGFPPPTPAEDHKGVQSGKDESKSTQGYEKPAPSMSMEVPPPVKSGEHERNVMVEKKAEEAEMIERTKEKIFASPDIMMKEASPRKNPSVLMPFPVFPWPPPQASATEVIPRELLEAEGNPTLLKEIDRKITEALERNGYYESSYYAIPGGFALATKMEQIESDGKSMQGSQRWLLNGICQ